MTAVRDRDKAVRDYLTFLEDPRRLVDEARLAALERDAEQCADPVERLHLFAKIEQGMHPVEAPYRDAFIRHARKWAEANGVSAPAFQRIGVPDAVLTAAGIGVEEPEAGQPEATQRRVVRVEDVVNVIRGQASTFSLPSIRAQTGASPMTVRRAVNELIKARAVSRLGPDPSWSSPGRAPVLYQLKKRR